MSELSQIALLDFVSQQLYHYVGIAIFVFGVVGNFLNCLVLSQRALRTNPCALFFLFSSFASLVSILIGFTTRLLASWNVDPTGSVLWLCKWVSFIVYASRTHSLWLIMLATVDRWLSSSSSVAYRRLSSLKIARRSILMCLLFSTALYAHMFYCYEANLTDTPLRCYGRTATCRLLSDVTYMLASILFPLVMMAVFGLMTVGNVRQMRRRVNQRAHSLQTRETSATNGGQQLLKSRDRHLLVMLFVQVILLILLFSPLVIQKLHASLTINASVSRLYIVSEQFAYNICVLLAFVAAAMPFYIYTLTGGKVFRKALADLLMNTTRTITRRRE